MQTVVTVTWCKATPFHASQKIINSIFIHLPYLLSFVFFFLLSFASTSYSFSSCSSVTACGLCTCTIEVFTQIITWRRTSAVEVMCIPVSCGGRVASMSTMLSAAWSFSPRQESNTEYDSYLDKNNKRFTLKLWSACWPISQGLMGTCLKKKRISPSQSDFKMSGKWETIIHAVGVYIPKGQT